MRCVYGFVLAMVLCGHAAWAQPPGPAIGSHSSSGEGALPDGKLLPDDPLDLNHFGWAVAVSGHTAVVGAPTRDPNMFTGAVYIFERDGGTGTSWHQVLKLTAPDQGLNHQFGHSVALDGDTLVVGAVGDERLGQFTGSAYVFERHHGGSDAWGLVKKLLPAGAMRGDAFGESVAIDGDTVVVGADQTGPPFPIRPGFVSVFERNQPGPNQWGEVARLAPGDSQSRDAFGFSVAISGDRLVVGAPQHDGTTYVFSKVPGATVPWRETARLPQSGGWSVAISGDTLVSGNPNNLATVFTLDVARGTWIEAARLAPESIPQVVSFGFGTGVAISGNTIVVGFPDDEEKGGLGSRSGSAHVFARRPGAGEWHHVAKLTSGDGTPANWLGWGVALDGTTAILGAPMIGNTPGAAYVCALDALSTDSGACRRAIPVVNALVRISDQRTDCCAGGEFVITATFTNITSRAIADPFFELVQIYGGTLQNADGGPGVVGAVLTPDVGDRVLAPGEAITQRFVIHLDVTGPFWLRVNLRGEPEPEPAP